MSFFDKASERGIYKRVSEREKESGVVHASNERARNIEMGPFWGPRGKKGKEVPEDRVGYVYTMVIVWWAPEEARESKSGELIVARAAVDARDPIRSAGLICEPHVCCLFLPSSPFPEKREGTLSMVRGSEDSGAP